MIIKINFSGYLKCGNFGDNIFIVILLELIKENLMKNFNINFNNFFNKKPDLNKKISINKINILGGGSIISPTCSEFTDYIKKNDNDFLIILTTGITDQKKCGLNEHNIYKFINNFNSFLFKNQIIKKNIENIKKNKKIFGCFRGILEKKIFLNHNYNFDCINDIGLLSDKINDNKIINFFSKNINKNLKLDHVNKKIILVNLINITGNDVFKNKNLNKIQYNKNIDFFLIEISKYLIEKDFHVVLIPFSNSVIELKKEKHIYIEIKKKIDEKYHNCVDMFSCLTNNNNTYQNYLEIIKKSYFVVGIRLHSNIIPNSFLIPTLNIAYGIKGINYAKTNNFEKYLMTTYIEDLKLEKFIEKFNLIIKDYELIKKILIEKKKILENKFFIDIFNILKNYNIDKFNSFDIFFDFKSMKFSNIYLSFN